MGGPAEVTAVGPAGHVIALRGGQWVDAQTNAPIGSGNTAPTLAQRGSQIGGPAGARAQATSAGRITQSQTSGVADQEAGTNNVGYLLHTLGQARRLIDSGAPTGSVAPEALWASRAAPAARGWLGIPSSYDTERLGTLEKDSGLVADAANTASASAANGSDQSSRASLRNSIFSIDKDQNTNRNNVTSLLSRFAGEALAQRATQAWLARFNDTTSQQHGINLSDYIMNLRNNLPTNGADFEDPTKYNTAMRTPDGGTFDLPEVRNYVPQIASSVRGENDFGTVVTDGGVALDAGRLRTDLRDVAANPSKRSAFMRTYRGMTPEYGEQLLQGRVGQGASQSQPAAPAQQPRFQEGQIYRDAAGNQARFTNGQFVPVR